MTENTKVKQTVIITGGNSGLGYQCAKAIARSDKSWNIVIASRNPHRVKAAVQRLIAETKHPYIEGFELDLASLQSVRHFIEQLSQSDLPPIKGAICNAGVQFVKGDVYTQDGFEATFGVNHLGHFLLVNLLLPYLKNDSRIILVSSDTHDPRIKTGMPVPQYCHPHQMAFPSQQTPRKIAGRVGRRRYTTSKLCNLLFAYELDRRLQNDERMIRVSAFNPGLMLDTQLARGYSIKEMLALVIGQFWHLLPHILRFRNSKKMGRALASLLFNPSFAEVSGKYFDAFKEIPSSPESYDRNKARELWNESIQLVGLRNSV
ncbi:MAG: SDR family NAD(P)-dependent oxidoreductase [Oscillatoria sp. SIO1A7]|nr:SDR family NAD(P)-dependent oxidoreductase [Oscillatoria sp. SIO1A7]